MAEQAGHNLIDGSTNRINLELATGIKIKACPGGAIQITDNNGNGIQIATGGAVTVIGSGSLPAAGVTSFNGRTGVVVPVSGDYLVNQVTGAAPLASPALTGNPTAPTQAPGSNDTKIATDAYADAAVLVETTARTTAVALKANIASPTFTGVPAAPTAAPGDNTTQIATDAFVTAAISAALQTASVTLSAAQVNSGAVVQVVAAPGAGKMIVPLCVVYEFVRGSAAFVSNGSEFSVSWQSLGLNATNAGITGDSFIDQATSQIFDAGWIGVQAIGTTTLTQIVNQALVAGRNSLGGVPTGGGTSTLKIFVIYQVITV